MSDQKIGPFSLQEQKLKSFSIGTMGKRSLSRKEQEDLKRKQEEDEVGKVYKEFVSTFEDNPQAKVNKTWVKAGTFNAGNRKEDTAGKGQLYKPTSKFETAANLTPKNEASPMAPMSKPEKPGKKKEKEKKKSNLEMFKEELKAIQEEREERHRYKHMIKSGGAGGMAGGGMPSMPPVGLAAKSSLSLETFDKEMNFDKGSHDNGDPATTNLYLGNLSPRLSEHELMVLFGKHGPLASVKIMWPRTEDEKSRGRHCGFVAFMARKDAERAQKALIGKMIEGFEMKMGWGKQVPMPMLPIYIPPALQKYLTPPNPSGLPFNAHPNSKEDIERYEIDRGPVHPPKSEEEYEVMKALMYRSTVKVTIPTDRTQLCLINRMVEFVIREGPLFEAMVMNREINNPAFTFLFENRSNEHIYYRWRLFSMLQGDGKENWSLGEFRMFKGGSLWKPPPYNLYCNGMPDEIIAQGDMPLDDGPVKEERSVRKRHRSRSQSPRGKKAKKSASSNTALSNSQRERFEDMLRGLFPDRNPLAEAMVWCIEHADQGQEIVECLAESLDLDETPIAKKIARLYLISDILHNCSIKGIPNVSYYRKAFQSILPAIFASLYRYHSAIEQRMKAEAFRQRVMSCFRAWEDWALYPMDYLIKLQNVFLGLINSDLTNKNGEEEEKKGVVDDDVDGAPLSDDDVDGIPLDGAAFLKSAAQQKKGSQNPLVQATAEDSDSDVDGAPIDTSRLAFSASQVGGQTLNKAKALLGIGGGGGSGGGGSAGFVPSKWETVDPEEVSAQAMTTSKFQLDAADDDAGTDVDGDPIDEDPRSRAREAIASQRSRRSSNSSSYHNSSSRHDDNSGGSKKDEERRAKMREVEIKVMKYQDSLESGKEKLKTGWTLSEMVERFRRKLVQDIENGSSSRGGRGDSDDTDDDEYGGRQSRSDRKSRKDNKSSKKIKKV